MIASLRADTLKARKRTANWILVGILLAWLILLSYVLDYFIFKHPPPGFRSEVPPSVLIRIVFPENVIPTVLSVLGTIGAAVMLIMGALSTASEYGWSTVQTILVQKPGRGAVLGGKIVNLALTSLIVTLVLFLVAAAVYHYTRSTFNTFVMHASQNTLAVLLVFALVGGGGTGPS